MSFSNYGLLAFVPFAAEDLGGVFDNFLRRSGIREILPQQGTTWRTIALDL